MGSDPAVREMYITMTEDPSAGYIVKGYYANDDIAGAPQELKKLGTMEDLNRILESKLNDTINGSSYDLDEIFCSLSHQESDQIVKIMHFCDKNVVHFYYLPRLFGEYKLHLDSHNFMGKTVYTNHLEPLSSVSNRILKRAFDIAVSGVNTFMCLKFRSMHVNKDSDKAQATKNDPRKFAFGNFMRKTNIDEFPQFINVLKGDMSIVGPRPHMLYHTEVYGSLIDKYMVRHFSKPGITGWAQVTGYRGETKEFWQMEERIKRDIWYIENWSFWLDIRIIFLTAKSIICPDKNAY